MNWQNEGKVRLWGVLAITFSMITNQVLDRRCNVGVTQRLKERLLVKTKQVGSDPKGRDCKTTTGFWKSEKGPCIGRSTSKVPKTHQDNPVVSMEVKISMKMRLWYINGVERSVEDSEIVQILKFDWPLGSLRILVEFILNLNSIAVRASSELLTYFLFPLASAGGKGLPEG